MNKQTGSMHVVAIVIGIIALVGGLGFVFWNNINKNTSESNAREVSKSDKVPVNKKLSSETKTDGELIEGGLMTSDNLGISYKRPINWSGGVFGGGSTLSDEESTTLTAPDGFTINMTIGRIIRGWSATDVGARVVDVQKLSGTDLTWLIADYVKDANQPIRLEIAMGQEKPAVGSVQLPGSSLHLLGQSQEGANVYLEIYGSYGTNMSLQEFNSKESVKQAKAIFESIRIDA